MEVSQWRDELRIDLRKWRDGKPTKQMHQFYPDAMEELYQSVRVYGSCLG